MLPKFLQIWAVIDCECPCWIAGSFWCLLEWRVVGGHGDQVRTDPKRDLLPVDWASTE